MSSETTRLSLLCSCRCEIQFLLDTDKKPGDIDYYESIDGIFIPTCALEEHISAADKVIRVLPKRDSAGYHEALRGSVWQRLSYDMHIQMITRKHTELVHLLDWDRKYRAFLDEE